MTDGKRGSGAIENRAFPCIEQRAQAYLRDIYRLAKFVLGGDSFREPSDVPTSAPPRLTRADCPSRR